ncbi:MAG: hypothetical protein ACYTGL_10255 [Planctomycetota bacterium]|jgi:hypothetical protein
MSRVFRILLGLFLLPLVGCATAVPLTTSNPMFVPASSHEQLWENTVDVLHAYQFPIHRENKLDGVIETEYKPGASVLEPWHGDSVTSADRWESSLQSIRRKAKVSMTPVDGGYLVAVEVEKEIEDPDYLIINSQGYATFPQAQPLQRDLDVVVGAASPEGWHTLGRDSNLEQTMLQSLRDAYVR